MKIVVLDGYASSAYDASDNWQAGQRNGFLFSLLVLSAHVVQADGKIMHSELEHVRKFIRGAFGEEAVEQANEILLRLFDYRKKVGTTTWDAQIRLSCAELASSTPEDYRVQLLAFMAEIAKIDGHVDPTEIAAIREIAVYLKLNAALVDQLFALGGNTLEDAYKVLGVSPQATDDEVRKAYKQMALKHHPDRVANLGEDIRAAATKKLQEINEAKDRIYKARGMV